MQLQDLYKFVLLSVCKILRQSEEISFPSFFRRMLMSAFLLRFKVNYLDAWLPQFFFVDSNSPYKDLFFPHGLDMTQKHLYVVGTVLKGRI